MHPDREQVNLAAQYLLRRVARRLGWHVVRADYYSPIVDVTLLPASAFSRQAPMHGVQLRLDAQLELLEREVAPYLVEWNPLLQPPGDGLGFYLLNPFYGPLDAEILYGFLRSRRPSRLIELGSGFSTLVVRHAAAANAREGNRLEHTVIDPYPSHLLRGLEGFRQIEQSAAEGGPSLFGELEAGDVLFVDSTHVVKPGGEVLHLILEVLPRLAPGVIVHFHDIFRPFEYPSLIYRRYNKHWQEHYLLEAFLAYNTAFQVLCSNHALSRLYPERMTALAPSLLPEMVPSGFWFEKLAPTPACDATS